MTTFLWTMFWLVLIGLVADALHGYLTSTGTIGERILAVGKQSETIVVTRLAAISGLGMNAVVEIANALNAPGVALVIDKYLDPKVVGYVMVAMALVVEVARRRGFDAPIVGQTKVDV